MPAQLQTASHSGEPVLSRHKIIHFIYSCQNGITCTQLKKKKKLYKIIFKDRLKTNRFTNSKSVKHIFSMNIYQSSEY